MGKEPVTIAIPLYNAEKYIEKSLESALGQTYDNIEILIVNDASTDNSVNIVEGISKSHPRGGCIRLIHHEGNKGVAMARNTLLDNAKGDFLYFLDSDDLMTSECIERLVHLSIKNEDDLVISSFREVNADGSYKDFHYEPIHKEGEFSLCSYNYHSGQRLGWSMWNILYRMAFLQQSKVSVRKFKNGEDTIFNLELFPYAKSFDVISDITYYYMKRAGSLSKYEEEHIRLDEFHENRRCALYTKQYLLTVKDRPYFDDMIKVIMTDLLYQVEAIIRKRKSFTPQEPKEIVQLLSRHPLTLKEILRRKENLSFNIAAYLFGILPYRAKCTIWHLYKIYKK